MASPCISQKNSERLSYSEFESNIRFAISTRYQQNLRKYRFPRIYEEASQALWQESSQEKLGLHKKGQIKNNKIITRG